MLDLRPILLVTGVLLATLGVAMMVPALVDLAAENDDWRIFAASSLLTMMIGLALWLSSRGSPGSMGLRQAFVMTCLVWIVLSAFGALPLLWSGSVPTYTDAFFEAMSGLTTTGATVIVGLDHAAPGVLFWRAILQWLGGLGIIVMALAVLPMLKVGGMQLFKAEAFDAPEKILPRATQISGIMTLIFIGLTGTCAILYHLAGMALDDAIMHAMTTVATGGFSTKDASLGHFDSAAIDWIAVAFMCIGSLPFLLYIKLLRGEPRALLRDTQVRTFFMLLAIFILIIWLFQHHSGIHDGIEGLRYAAFNVVSVMTGTGYANADYNAWGPFSAGLFFIIMFIGGCAGSTSCGIKVFRLQVLWASLGQHFNRSVYPNGIFVPRFNGRPIDDNVVAAVQSFFFLYICSFAGLAIALNMTGLDDLTALSGAATAISNVGPGLGEIIGPAGTFQSLNDPAKWVLSFGMLLGRLELLTVLVLFIPRFWRG
ncbi:trk system potassium uptake protein TrkH [Breoghania corrubedonensis]|uniref:Trk system potassium uptake protein n=1 Tax=Breoghania corrubedonensis TaxID=665038 RepID=A0A2T5VEE4_9HYPH|nr:TrkH family potassium uptake protein [Breoghania corrubedonensis]PTW62129.1 trk system potassium uptake protein TrkH [Breoghania corrubedonensis]